MKNKALKMSMRTIGLMGLCAMLLSIACKEPPEMTHNIFPPGMGGFSLSAFGLERTIIPQDITLDSFRAYTMYFYDHESYSTDPDAEPVLTVERTPSNHSNYVFLRTGRYRLEVRAFLNDTRTTHVATGVLPDFNINEGEASTHNVMLQVVVSGQGQFEWEITFPAGLTKAMMTVTPLDSSGNPEARVHDLLLGLPAPPAPPLARGYFDDLPAGSYRVEIVLEKEGYTHPIIYRDILHIYQNLISFFTFNFLEEHFNSIIYKVFHLIKKQYREIVYELTISKPMLNLPM
jgi:hypothetical protein